MLAYCGKDLLFAWGKNVHVSVSDTCSPESKPPILGTPERSHFVLRPRVALNRGAFGAALKIEEKTIASLPNINV